MARTGTQQGRNAHPTSSRPSGTKPSKYSGYLPVAKVFKPASADSLPERDLHDVEVYSKDFQKLKNLLNVNEEGPFHIFGIVYPQDGPDENLRLGAPKPNGYGLEINNVVTYTIDCAPFPKIWAHTEFGYFKIATTSLEYAPILETMKQGVDIFDALMDLEDDFQSSEKKNITIQDVKFTLALRDGSGVTEKEILDHVSLKEHAPFILSHLSQNKQQDSMIFTRLKKFLRHYRATPSPSPERLLTPPRSPPKQLLPTPPEDIWPKKTSVGRQAYVGKPKHDDLSHAGEKQASALLAAGVTQVTPVDFILQILADKDPKTSEIKDSTVWGAIYRLCNVWRPPLGVAIFKLHSAELLRRLPPEWMKTSFGAQVKYHAVNSCTAKQAAQQIEAAKKRPARTSRGNPDKHQIKMIRPEEWLEEAAEMVPELKLRIKKTMASRVNSRGGVSSEPDADVPMTDAKPTRGVAHRQQPIIQSEESSIAEPPTDEQGRSREFNDYIESITSRSADDQANIDRAKKGGRGAGKRSTLKPKTLKRPSQDDDDPMDGGGPRKRSRNGENSDSDTSDGESPSAEQLLAAEQGFTDVISLVQKEGNLTHRPYNHLEQYLKDKAPEFDTAGVQVPSRIQRRPWGPC